MNTHLAIPFFLLFLFSTNLFAQKNYKGVQKYQQPEIEILPKNTEYIFNHSLDDTLEIKLNGLIDELFKKHNIAGVLQPLF